MSLRSVFPRLARQTAPFRVLPSLTPARFASGSELASEAALEQDLVEEEYDNSQLAGIGYQPFPPEVREKLLRPVDESEVELRPDGNFYLSNNGYRRILNDAFGPGGWGMMPQGPARKEAGARPVISREWALICLGRPVSVARGFHIPYKAGPEGLKDAEESAKSNALMRCCKDLGIASELWNRRYIADLRARRAAEKAANGPKLASAGRTSPYRAA